MTEEQRRRSLARGTGWTSPVVRRGTTAPETAASPTCPRTASVDWGTSGATGLGDVDGRYSTAAPGSRSTLPPLRLTISTAGEQPTVTTFAFDRQVTDLGLVIDAGPSCPVTVTSDSPWITTEELPSRLRVTFPEVTSFDLHWWRRAASAAGTGDQGPTVGPLDLTYDACAAPA